MQQYVWNIDTRLCITRRTLSETSNVVQNMEVKYKRNYVI